MSSDSTYLFFRRDLGGSGDDQASHAPVINTTRVVKRGGLRGGSVPPVHLTQRPSRAASVQPQRGFTRPTPVIHTVTSASSGRGSVGGPSVGRLSLAGPSTSSSSYASSLSSSVTRVPFASVSGYQPRPVARRASIAAPGGSTLRIWSVGSGATSPSASSSLRGLTEVTKGTAARSSVYRPSSQAGFGRSTSGSVRVGLGQAGVARSAGGGGGGGVSSGAGGSYGRSRPAASVYRRASISSYGGGGSGWDEDLGPRPLPAVRTQQRASYVGGGGGGGGGGGTAVGRAASARPLQSSNRFNVRVDDVSSGEKGRPGKTSDNDVHYRKKYDYEKQLEDLMPLHEDSLAKLRARAQVAKDHLSRHRILLDRYLPVQLGPDGNVVDEVETRYGELLSRMPHLDKRQKSNNDRDEYVSVIPPYKPASTTSKAPKLSYDIANTPVSKSFTPKISDTRKRARSVLCKIKGDPKYFDF